MLELCGISFKLHKSKQSAGQCFELDQLTMHRSLYSEYFSVTLQFLSSRILNDALLVLLGCTSCSSSLDNRHFYCFQSSQRTYR